MTISIKTTMEINNYIKHSKGLIDENKISDGYHTFGELYKHRIHLFIALCSTINYSKGLYDDYGDSFHRSYSIIKSKKHYDGSSFDGWFILQLETTGGQISYHLPIEKDGINYWNKCDFVETREKADKWDGHTSDDVLERLFLI